MRFRSGSAGQLGSGAAARVTVYRYKRYLGKALCPSIYCDELYVARIQDGRYVVLALSPGAHAMRSNGKQPHVEEAFLSR